MSSALLKVAMVTLAAATLLTAGVLATIGTDESSSGATAEIR